MFTAKVLASLFLLAAAGFLDGTGRAPVLAASSAAPERAPDAAMAPVPARLQDAVHAALRQQVRDALGDDSVQVELAPLQIRRDGLLTVSADGDARVSLGAGGTLPVRVEADWDLQTQRLARVDYRISGPAADAPAEDAIGQRMRDAIAAQVREGLAAEFSGQSSAFELLSVDRVQSGRHRMLVTGAGITRFAGEGAAYTRFTASVGKFDGGVQNVTYELLGDVESPTPALAAR